MKIFSLVGWSGSGKTTLIIKLITFFKQNKKTIAALKNVPRQYSVQPEGKDSWKFLEAGANKVFLTSGDEILYIRKKSQKDNYLNELYSDLKDFDLVFWEGLTGENIPLIEVFNSRQNKKLKFPFRKLTAIVSDRRIDCQIPCFDINDIHTIAKYMEEYNDF